jgi:subfamily B ATP-binding cassette protein HlyB/CyaB
MEVVRQDTGLQCLALLLRFHQVPADPAQIAHQLGGRLVGVTEILRCAKDLKLKARAVNETWSGLSRLPLPAIIQRRDETFVIAGKVGADDILVQDPLQKAPQIIKRADFEANWNGCVVLLARRASLADLARHFDVTWFLQAMYKYRRLLAEVMLASFFLQLFALVTPLFFQVVTDKVLTHRGYTTLDVLVFGLVTVSIFESVLGGLRTYVFSHTTNRIDVELGARLFKHLIALPIAYFEARRAGDSVARVRELENIRNFLTSSALTLVIDVAFTFVFLSVMFYYSPFLSWIVVGSFPFYIAISAGVTPIFRKRLEKKFDRGA